MKQNKASKSTGINLSRRQVLKAAAAVTASATLPGCGGDTSSTTQTAANPLAAAIDTVGNKLQPNILFILVDEMRFPKVFPAGISTAEQFLQKFMPNTYQLWAKGVKFSNHITATTACTPSRGVLLTGLYSHQTWLVQTFLPLHNFSVSPVLRSDYPTYGKLLFDAGFDTPYIGKWHVSMLPDPPDSDCLKPYGFSEWLQSINVDPIGYNLQGTFGQDIFSYKPTSDQKKANKYVQDGPFYGDKYIAGVAVDWIKNKKSADKPWCLTVGFINPHDQEAFPAGTDYQNFTATFTPPFNTSYLDQYVDWTKAQCVGTSYPPSSNICNNPKNFGYPTVPPNWESLTTLIKNKPKWQTVFKQASSMLYGGINDSSASAGFIAPVIYPNTSTSEGYKGPTSKTLFNPGGNSYGIGIAPYTYWQKAFDVYTELHSQVDLRIGEVVNSLPPDVAATTIIVFTSDHGDYVGAHGLISGKTGSFYDEAVRVPLIVYDPTGQFTGDITTIRSQLTSSVDIMPMLASFAYGGTRSWMEKGFKSEEYKMLYQIRHDMFPLLKSASAAGRSYALFASDESEPGGVDFLTPADAKLNKTPYHILGLVTPQAKLAIYSNWPIPGLTPTPQNQTYEYYDYSTPNGQLELDNTYNNNANAVAMKDDLLKTYLPNEIEAPIPWYLRGGQELTKIEMAAFLALIAIA